MSEVSEDFKVETRARFDRLEDKVDKILEFKWRWMGGVAVFAFLVTLAVELVRR
jgi:hypothetical protein